MCVVCRVCALCVDMCVCGAARLCCQARARYAAAVVAVRRREAGVVHGAESKSGMWRRVWVGCGWEGGFEEKPKGPLEAPEA